ATPYYAGEEFLSAGNDFGAVELHQIREVVQLAHDDPVDHRECRRAHESPVVLHEREQLLTRRAGVWNPLACDDCLDYGRAYHLAEQRFLVWEVEVYGALGHSGLSGNVFQACACKAVLAKYLERSVQDLLGAFFRKPPPARVRNFCGHKCFWYVTDQSVTYSGPAMPSTSSRAPTAGYSTDAEDGRPLVRADWLHREPASFSKQFHLLQLADVPQAREVEEVLESVASPNVDHVPDRVGLAALGVIMLVRRVPCGKVRVALPHDLCRPHYPGGIRAGVIEEHAVALLHVIAHEVAGLVVTHTAPVCRPAG